jgi:hypothetical protein
VGSSGSFLIRYRKLAEFDTDQRISAVDILLGESIDLGIIFALEIGLIDILKSQLIGTSVAFSCFSEWQLMDLHVLL